MRLGPCFCFIAPGLIGRAGTADWCGSHAVALTDKARAIIIELIDAIGQPVHIVGHSYGGGVALKIARERPRHVASLALYEPSAFHILREAGADAREMLAEIEQIARAVGDGLVSGAYQQAVQEFVDYWNGPGGWASMRPDRRDALVKWLPKAPLDFQALIMDDMPLDRIGRVTCPVLLLRGEYARRPSFGICDLLAEHLPEQRTVIIAGAGHMGRSQMPTRSTRLSKRICGRRSPATRTVSGSVPWPRDDRPAPYWREPANQASRAAGGGGAPSRIARRAGF